MLVFWVITPCELVGRHHVSEDHTASIFRSEYGGSMFLLDIGIYLQVHMASHRRRPTSTHHRRENLKSLTCTTISCYQFRNYTDCILTVLTWLRLQATTYMPTSIATSLSTNIATCLLEVYRCKTHMTLCAQKLKMRSCAREDEGRVQTYSNLPLPAFLTQSVCSHRDYGRPIGSSFPITVIQPCLYQCSSV
jgi:hypothetical protein